MMTLDSSATPAAVLTNAAFLAAASSFAYWDEDKGREDFKSDLDLDAHLISRNNTQVFVAQNDAAIVAAFRGTESPTTLDGLKDCLLTDANDLLILPEGRIGTDFAAAGVGVCYHRGFLTALADIWDPLFAAVDAEMKKKSGLYGLRAIAWAAHWPFWRLGAFFKTSPPFFGSILSVRLWWATPRPCRPLTRNSRTRCFATCTNPTRFPTCRP
jgi:hypothetical protein